MNSLPSKKCFIAPNKVEKKSLGSEQFKERFDMTREEKISKEVGRQERYHKNIYNRKKLMFRQPLELGEEVLNLSERIK